MKRHRYTQVRHELGRFSPWRILIHPFPGRTHRTGCCDCGLVHDSQTRAYLIKRNRKGEITGYLPLSSKHVVVMQRVRRNDRSTAGKRRAAKYAPVRKALRHGR